MIKALEESDKRIGRSHKLLGLCFLLAVISFSLFGLGFEYGLLGLIPLPFILVILQIKMINEVGLVSYAKILNNEKWQIIVKHVKE